MTSALTILHLLDGRFHCGASVVTRMLVKALQQHGVDARLICLYEGEVTTAARAEQLDPVVLPGTGSAWHRLQALRQILQTHSRAGRKCILHSHQMRANRFACVAAACQHIPHVITIHAHNEELLRDLFPRRSKRALIRAIHYATLDRAAARIAVSPGVLRQLHARGYAPGRTQLIRNLTVIPEPVQNVASIRQALRAELQLPDDAWWILSAGRLVAVKQFDVLLQALATMTSPPLERAVVLLAGEGPLRPELEQSAEALGIRDRVRFLGWRTDLQRLIAACDCTISTSRSECSPVFVIEAMSLERPVVAAAAEDVAALIQDKEQGLLFPVGSPAGLVACLTRIASEPGLAPKLGQAARQRIQAWFDTGHTLQQTLALYEDVSHTKPRRTPA